MLLSPESERILNNQFKPTTKSEPIEDPLEIFNSSDEEAVVQPIRAVNRKRVLQERSTALVGRIKEKVILIDLEDQQCYPLECATFRQYFFPSLRVLCIVTMISISLFNLTCFYIKNPPIDPMLASFYFAIICIGGLGIDVIVSFILEMMKCQCGMKFIVNCLFHHVCTIACLFSPLIGDNRQFYILMYIVFLVDINTIFLRLRKQLNREGLAHKIVNFLFFFSWFSLRLILVPIFTGYFWYLWIQNGYLFDLHLNAAIQCTNLIGLYLIWTYNLLNKLSNKTKSKFPDIPITKDMTLISSLTPSSIVSTISSIVKSALKDGEFQTPIN